MTIFGHWLKKNVNFMKPWRPEDLPKTLVITRMQEWSRGNRQIDQKCESHKRFSVRCFSINRKLRLLLMPIQNHLFGQPNSERSDIPKVNRNNTIISTCIRMGKLAAERYWKAFSTFSSPKKTIWRKYRRKENYLAGLSAAQVSYTFWDLPGARKMKHPGAVLWKESRPMPSEWA